MICKRRFSAVLSPVRVDGEVLLHDDRGIFALAKAANCRKCEGDAHTGAGVTAVEKAALYAGHTYMADVNLKQQFAQDNKSPAGDVAFMCRKGQGWRDITAAVACVKSLCHEQAAGTDPDLAAVAKAAHDAIEGIAAQPHGEQRGLDLLTDTLAALTSDEPLHTHVERMAEEFARVQVTRKAYGILKHIDPVTLLAIEGDSGFLSHVPRIKHAGREFFMVNMLKAQGYDRHRIHALVKQGEAVACKALTPDMAAQVAPYQAEEFKDVRDFYFIPLTIEKRYTAPVLLKRYKMGKLFACQREMAEVIKREIAELDPDAMAKLATPEMQTLLQKLADVTVESSGSAREQYLHSIFVLVAELKKRGEKIELPKDLEGEIRKMAGLVEKGPLHTLAATPYQNETKPAEAKLEFYNTIIPLAQKTDNAVAIEFFAGEGNGLVASVKGMKHIACEKDEGRAKKYKNKHASAELIIGDNMKYIADTDFSDMKISIADFDASSSPFGAFDAFIGKVASQNAMLIFLTWGYLRYSIQEKINRQSAWKLMKKKVIAVCNKNDLESVPISWSFPSGKTASNHIIYGAFSIAASGKKHLSPLTEKTYDDLCLVEKIEEN